MKLRKHNKRVSITKVRDKTATKFTHKTVNNTDVGECINYDKKGRQHLESLLTRESGSPVTFLYDKRFAHIQSKIQLAPVALLKKHNEPQFWGVYTNHNLTSKLELGEYLGEKLSTEGTDRTTNVDYSFDLENGYEVNAKRKRSWHAMINGTSSPDSANVCAERRGEHIHYYTARDIKAGEQLLIHYGYDYQFKDKRFLNPNDTWDNSDATFKKNLPYYQTHQILPAEFKEILDLQSDDFVMPDVQKITKNSVDLPILAVDKLGDLILQNQQENITLLQLACFNGDIFLVKRLLAMGANPSQQTSITGLSPLHCVVLSKNTFEQKKVLIELIMKKPNASLALPDKFERSILHLAIETEQIELINYLLEPDKKLTPARDTHPVLKKRWNEKMSDYCLLFLEKHNIQVLNALKDFITIKELKSHLTKKRASLFETALNEVCRNSTSAQWSEIKLYLDNLVGKNTAVKSNLGKLMPVKHTIRTKDELRQKKTPVHAQRGHKLKFFAKSDASGVLSPAPTVMPVASERASMGAAHAALSLLLNLGFSVKQILNLIRKDRDPMSFDEVSDEIIMEQLQKNSSSMSFDEVSDETKLEQLQSREKIFLNAILSNARFSFQKDTVFIEWFRDNEIEIKMKGRESYPPGSLYYDTFKRDFDQLAQLGSFDPETISRSSVNKSKGQ